MFDSIAPVRFVTPFWTFRIRWSREAAGGFVVTVLTFVHICPLVSNTHLTLQVMRRAQSNSPRIPPKKYHSFKETRDINIDTLLLLPGYKPPRPRPPSYPAHVSPSRNHLHVPRIRVTCVPELVVNRPVISRQGPDRRPGRSSGRSPGRNSSKSPGRSPGRSPESRGRTPGRWVSQRMKKLSRLPLLGPGVCAG